MRFEFIDDTEDGESELPEPADLKDYVAWSGVHYGLMGHLADRFPDLKVSNTTKVPVDLWYGDDWFEVRKTSVVAASWRAFSLPIAQAIQDYLRLHAQDWFVTYAVESVREMEIGVLQVEVTISATRIWVHSFERTAEQTLEICRKWDVLSWLIEDLRGA